MPVSVLNIAQNATSGRSPGYAFLHIRGNGKRRAFCNRGSRKIAREADPRTALDKTSWGFVQGEHGEHFRAIFLDARSFFLLVGPALLVLPLHRA